MIKEYLQQLGHPYRKQALKNMNPLVADKPAEDKADALERAFSWYETPEGFEYWNRYWNYLVDKDLKKQLAITKTT